MTSDSAAPAMAGSADDIGLPGARRTHCACGVELHRGTKSGRCATCTAADPAVRAKKGKLTPEQRARRSETARRLSADPAVLAKRAASLALRRADPEYRRRHAEGCKRAKAERMQDPAFRAMLSDAGRRYGALNIGAAMAPEARAKAQATTRAKHLAWCPPEHWQLNADLKRKRILLADRKRIIGDEIARASPEAAARRAIAEFDRAQRARAEHEKAQAY